MLLFCHSVNAYKPDLAHHRTAKVCYSLLGPGEGVHCSCSQPIAGIPDAEPLFCFHLLIIRVSGGQLGTEFESRPKIAYNQGIHMLFSKVI